MSINYLHNLLPITVSSNLIQSIMSTNVKNKLVFKHGRQISVYVIKTVVDTVVSNLPMKKPRNSLHPM